jgi:glycine cleavage system regulatory protein
MMDIHIQLPDSSSINSIEDDMNAVAEEINVDITVSP